jgi:TetR/AcrR family transcriptional repressor of bet genes
MDRKSTKGEATARNRETPEVRRKLLIEATMRSIARFGYAGTTIETICSEAGVSRGLINHHFGSKEELIRQSYKALRDEWVAATHGSVVDEFAEPEERLRALIRVSFGPTMFKQEYLGIWAGFWSAIGKSPTLRKMNRELFDKDREAYEAIFAEIARKRGKKIDTRRAALTVIALIDGFWLEWCLDPKSFTAAEAEAACLAFSEQTFA